ncbi:MAG: hypothetical protein IJ225_11635 [Solobacterium sp.]|nr:hypothetical protein [Solobacterium sp.]
MRQRKFIRKPIYFCYVLFFGFFLTTIPVHAYIDPSVMTYAIQAIAGIAIALGTFAGVYWKKLKTLLFGDALEEDKEIESDHLEFHDPSSGKTRTISFPETPVKARKTPFSPAVVLAVALGFMLCLYKPLELYVTNIHEFEYDIYTIFPYLLLLTAVVILIIVILYAIVYRISPSFYSVMVLLGLIAFVAFFIQGNLLVNDLPPGDGSVTDWSQYHTEELHSILIWVGAILLGIGSYLWLKPRKFLPISNLVSGTITLILAATLVVAIVRNDGLQHKTQVCIGNKNMNVMSSDQNMVIFVVDAMDSKTFHDLLTTTEPEYADVFEDFTYYPDTLGAYPWTKIAVPQLFTGFTYECQDEFYKWYDNALDESALLNRLKEEDYTIGLYDQMDVPIREKDLEVYENVSIETYGLQNPKTFLMDELRAIFFIYMPFQLKKYEPYALFNLTNQWPSDTYFSWHDDTTYYFFQDHPITLDEEKRFRFIHIEGAHPPYKYDRNLNDIEDTGEATYEQNLQATITVLEQYLRSLKEGGAFDNTAIVILGDHGYEDKIHSHTRQNPFLMVKGFNESHELVVSDLPVSYFYLPEIYQNLLDGTTGEAVIPSIAKTNPPRRYFEFAFDEVDYLEEMELDHAHASDADALLPTGKIYRQ